MIVKETLPNGITLVTEGMPHVRSVALGVWLTQGSRHEPAALCGISHFIEHMVFKGTRSRTAERIAAEVDAIGGHLDAFTSKEHSAFHLKVLDEHLPLAAEILGDIVVNPLFDAQDVAKEKRVVGEEISMVEDTPDDLVMELFAGAFWPEHPLGRPILGTRRSVASLRREAVVAHFRAVYRPPNVLVTAAGHLEHAEVSSLVARHLGGLSGGGERRAIAAPVPSARVVSRRKKELEQVHLSLGTRAYARTHSDRYAAHVLDAILGGSMSSRLFQNIRERRGLAYAISSGIASYSDAGSLTVYAGTSLGSVDEVLRLTVEELRRLRDEPVPEDELRRAKEHLKGGLVLSLESTGSRMSLLARQEMDFGRQLPLEEILGGIEAVERGDVERVARDLFSGDLALSILGNLGRYRPRPERLRA